MRVTNYALALSAVLFGLLLVPRAALAQATVADCPSEPKQGVPIVSGGVYFGANCVLYTPGDVDGFVFHANAGDTYQLTLGYQGGGTEVCLTLYDPNSAIIISKTCTNGGLVKEITLTTTGKYTILVTEAGGQAVDSYALSLERINPTPPDELPIGLSQEVIGAIAAPTEQNVFTFHGSATGTYEVTITYTGGPVEACIYLYYPGATAPSASGCTNSSYSFPFTPPQDGTYMVLINGAGNDGTVSYNLEIACILPTCKQVPYCKLADTLSYASGTLTMNFTIDNSYATTWNAWLIYQNGPPVTLFSTPQPITDSPAHITKTTTLSPEGNVGVLSTLTTPKKGIACSSWVQVETGAP